ncbi:MAG TPA: sigma 54-interacting transcriptional regulator, partial [Desulfobacterales bacterium]|nr:sigma 54-interacting transcriptional regulator [Desulfobacterales bacterium]
MNLKFSKKSPIIIYNTRIFNTNFNRLIIYLQENKMIPPIVGESLAIQNIKTLISKVAPTGENILICGETGVGKDLVAQSLYHKSKREGKPFVKVNCAGLTQSLLEIEIPCFHPTETNREFKKKGRLFEEISGGILYFDNIDLLSPVHQAEILQVLQKDNPQILDLKTPIQTDICVFSSTKQNLEKMVKEDKFSPSLYFRLSTVRIDIAPLRDRPEDIPLLIDYYFKKYASAYNGHNMMALPGSRTIDELCAYYWPGNVIELQNIIKRIIFSDDTAKNISDLIDNSKVGYENFVDNKTKEMSFLPMKRFKGKWTDLA